ncbi:MAG: THxN family PEP-CTERM protein [Cyanobacteria bacterium P01_H01_bin.121]
MMLSKYLLAIATGALASIGLSPQAQALSFTTSGTWATASLTDGTVANGISTNSISWGTGVGSGNSSYVFTGEPTTDLSFQESITGRFVLGTFTHNNFPITGETLSQATLQLNFNLGPVNTVFNFDFQHHETPNETPCNPTGTTICPDVVLIANNIATETITIANTSYNLTLLGFQNSDGSTAEQFLTEEGQANTAQLYARLTAVPIVSQPAANTAIDTIPEPAGVVGVVTTSGLLAYQQRKRRRSKQAKPQA